MIEFRLFGRRIILGYNAERTLRFGIHRERSFTAVGCWPLLVGIGRRIHA